MSARVCEDLPGVLTDTPESPVSACPRATSLGDLQRPLTDDPSELLKDRFLCRGGGLLFVGPTGVGKSSSSMQCMLLWALGHPAFGIVPTRTLKSLLIQAENDDGDLAEMRDGVIKGLELQPEDAATAFSRIVVCREAARTGMEFFRDTVRPLLVAHRPDLVWIDPALAFLGGEANSQEVVGTFLRNGLNPLLQEFNCAAVVVHHTNKPPKKNDGNGWSGSDFAYLGAGSAEWANWSRAVLALKSTPAPGIFELCAGKRGGRLNWRAPDESTRVYSKFIAHAKGDGEIYWRPATEAEVESTRAGGKTVGTSELGKVLMAIPAVGTIEKSKLIDACKLRGIGRDRATTLIKELIAKGKIHEVDVPRTGKRAKPEVHVTHGPKPQEEPPKAPPSCPPATTAEATSVLDVPDDPTGHFQSVGSSRGNRPEDDASPSGMILLPAPFKGAVGSSGGSASGFVQGDPSYGRPRSSSKRAGISDALAGSNASLCLQDPPRPPRLSSTGESASTSADDPARN